MNATSCLISVMQQTSLIQLQHYIRASDDNVNVANTIYSIPELRIKLRYILTRKHRQSYQHADPRRQRPQVAQRQYALPAIVTSHPATVTAFVPCDLEL